MPYSHRFNLIALNLVKLTIAIVCVSIPILHADDETPPPPPEAIEQNAPEAPPAPEPAAPAPAITPEAPPEAPPTAPSAEPSSGILATTSDVSIVRRSKSNQVYLLENKNPSEIVPPEGKLLLLKSGDQNVMALQVLKDFSDKNQFAAKNVKVYEPDKTLNSGENYTAIVKQGDYSAPPQTAQDKSDVKELEAPANVPAPVDEASSAPTPKPSPSVEPLGDLNPKEGEAATAKEVPPGYSTDEPSQLDHDSQGVTFEAGLIRNADSTGTTTTLFFSGGLRYALTIGRSIFIKEARTQDSLALETGVFYFDVVNFATTGDAYSVVPVPATLRYNILFGTDFTLFFYGGVWFNFATDTGVNNTQTQTVASNLGQIQPAFGTGLTFKLGPHWFARADLGYDILGLGVMLRF